MQQKKRIVLIGGGHSHALFLRQWMEHPLPQAELQVFEPQPKVAYTGMLPGFVAGHYDIDDLYIDIERLTKDAGGTFSALAVETVDPSARTLIAGGETFPYDVLSFDIGVHTATSMTGGGWNDHAVGVKPLTDFAHAWESFVANTTKTDTQAQLLVVGGGVAGVEVALAMAHRLYTETGYLHRGVIIDRGRILDGVAPRTRRVLMAALKRYGIAVREEVTLTQVNVTGATLDDQTVLKSDFTLVATGPTPYEWVRETTLPVTNGYIDIDSTLRSPKYPDVFAVGDCAHFLLRPLPKAGVFAVREAPILYHNIRAVIQGQTLREYTPQSDYLKLISLGEKRALADKWGFSIWSRCLWWLKDWIDRRFMNYLTKG